MKSTLLTIVIIALSIYATAQSKLDYKEYKDSEKPRLKSEKLDKTKEEIDKQVRENNLKIDSWRAESESNRIDRNKKNNSPSEADKFTKARELYWAQQRAAEQEAWRQYNLESARLQNAQTQLENLQNRPLRTMTKQDFEDLKRACLEGMVKGGGHNAIENLSWEAIGLGTTKGIAKSVTKGSVVGATLGCLENALKEQWKKALDELNDLQGQRERYQKEMEDQNNALQNSKSVKKSNCTISTPNYNSNNLPPGVSMVH